MRLEGKKAVVTGASSGIGAATARRFAEEGATVLAVARSRDLLEQLSSDVPQIHHLVCDIASEGAADAIIGEAVRVLGGVDILVNNAAYQVVTVVQHLPLEEWDRVMNVNLRSQFLICKQAIPELRKSAAGRIVNVSSLMADRADGGFAAYAASKAGVGGLTRILAIELGKYGITANFVLPGPVRSGMSGEVFDANPEIQDRLVKKMAIPRVGEPVEIANGILFFASDEASFVTGQGLVMDGGLGLRT